MPNFDIGQFILYMVALIFSLSVHESAHAWMSNYFGDDLARLQGRITLNPVAHVDPISLGLLEAPGNYGCALTIGEGQGAADNKLLDVMRDERPWLCQRGIAEYMKRAGYRISILDYDTRREIAGFDGKTVVVDGR